MTGSYIAEEVHPDNVRAINLGLEPPHVSTWTVDEDGHIRGVRSNPDPARAAAFTRLLHEVHDT